MVAVHEISLSFGSGPISRIGGRFLQRQRFGHRLGKARHQEGLGVLHDLVAESQEILQPHHGGGKVSQV